MTTIISYLYEYVKTNSLTGYFAIFLAALILFKYLPWKPTFSVRKILIGIMVLGFVLRIAWLLFSSHTPQSEWTDGHLLENDIINIQAIEVSEGIGFRNVHGEPSARRPIGYPLVLALGYKLLGPHLPVAWGMGIVMHLVTILLVFGITRLLFSDAVALLASFLFAINPISIYSIKLITDEHLFLPLWYGGLYLLLHETMVKEKKWNWIFYGLLFGWATMTRTHTIFMPFVVGIAYWLARFSWKKVIAGVLLTGFVMQLINLPWVIRNYHHWGEVVLYGATGGFVYAQVNDSATPKGGGHIPIKGEPGYSEELAQAMLGGNPAKVHKLANREMGKWIVSNPGKFTVMGISRLLYFMNWNRQDGIWPLWYQFYPGSFDVSRPFENPLKEIFEEYGFSFYYTLFYSWILSLFFIGRRWKALEPATKMGLIVLGACFAFWFMEHLIIYPIRKYRYPLEPLMLISSCYFYLYLLTDCRLEKLKNLIAKRK